MSGPGPFGGPGGPQDADFGFQADYGPGDRIDIYYGYRGYRGHGHMVLDDIDGDNELETLYDRGFDGDINYDSGE